MNDARLTLFAGLMAVVGLVFGALLSLTLMESVVVGAIMLGLAFSAVGHAWNDDLDDPDELYTAPPIDESRGAILPRWVTGRRIITAAYVLVAVALVSSVALWVAVLILGCWGASLALILSGGK